MTSPRLPTTAVNTTDDGDTTDDTDDGEGLSTSPRLQHRTKPRVHHGTLDALSSLRNAFTVLGVHFFKRGATPRFHHVRLDEVSSLRTTSSRCLVCKCLIAVQLAGDHGVRYIAITAQIAGDHAGIATRCD